MIARVLVVLSLIAVTASAGFGKDLCIQADNGSVAGSQIVVKKAKLGARNVAPAVGYLARFNLNAGGFFSFQTMAGGSVVASNGDLALGMMLYAPSVSPGGGSGNGTSSTTFNCLCTAGSDHKLNVLDLCNMHFDLSFSSGHVVDCTDLIAVP
jgi:hypothetical protein